MLHYNLINCFASIPLLVSAIMFFCLGGLFLGILEGWLVSLLVRRIRFTESIFIMIGSNYFSVCIAIFACLIIRENVVIPIKYFSLISIFLIVMLFLLIYICELPFILFLLKQKRYYVRKSLWINLVIQSVSYSLVIIYFVIVSSNSLDNVEVSSTSYKINKNISISYIPPDNKGTTVIKPSGKIQQQPKLSLNELLIISPVIVNGHISISNKKNVINFMYDNIKWEMIAYLEPANGLVIRQKKNPNQKINLRINTPFSVWNIKSATVIPRSGDVLFSTTNQVFIFSIRSKTIYKIANGSYAVVTAADSVVRHSK